jgi:hypothetical protein
MALDWLLHKKVPSAWADQLERRARGEETFGNYSARAEDVEEIFEAFQASSNVAETGEIALNNAAKYDDEFFEALDEVIARDRAYLLVERVTKLEGMREYLRQVRQWSDAGELEQAREAIVKGAAIDELREALKAVARDDPNTVLADLEEVLTDMGLEEIRPEDRDQILIELLRRARSDTQTRDDRES